MELDEINNHADALIHTSVDDARVSMRYHTTPAIIERALARIAGVPGHTTRRKMFEAYLKRNSKKGSKL